MLKLEDVLLTQDEIKGIEKSLCDTCTVKWCECDCDPLLEARHKAQCLKVLEWQKERCIAHPQYDEEIGGGMCKFYRQHQNCSECMSELEKLLKEGE